MNFYRKSKKIKFDEVEVEVSEITPLTLTKIINNEYKNELDLLQDHVNQDISNISVSAFNKLLSEFNELNKEHFETSNEGEELSEGK